MLAFIATTIFCFIIWLALTATGSPWELDEILAGILFSIIGGIVANKIFIKEYTLANPKKWLWFIVYLPFFFYEMAKANVDVAYRVITGKINPGIVKISPNLKNDISLTILANSITLTPGTLSIDTDEERNLYVHWINIDDKALEEMPRPYAKICASFPDWARRIGE